VFRKVEFIAFGAAAQPSGDESPRHKGLSAMNSEGCFAAQREQAHSPREPVDWSPGGGHSGHHGSPPFALSRIFGKFRANPQPEATAVMVVLQAGFFSETITFI